MVWLPCSGLKLLYHDDISSYSSIAEDTNPFLRLSFKRYSARNCSQQIHVTNQDGWCKNYIWVFANISIHYFYTIVFHFGTTCNISRSYFSYSTIHYYKIFFSSFALIYKKIASFRNYFFFSANSPFPLVNQHHLKQSWIMTLSIQQTTESRQMSFSRAKLSRRSLFLLYSPLALGKSTAYPLPSCLTAPFNWTWPVDVN